MRIVLSPQYQGCETLVRCDAAADSVDALMDSPPPWFVLLVSPGMVAPLVETANAGDLRNPLAPPDLQQLQGRHFGHLRDLSRAGALGDRATARPGDR